MGDLTLIRYNWAGRDGGAFAVEGYAARVILGASTTLSGNVAEGAGGAIAGTSGGNITIGANAQLTGNGASSGQGTAVFLTDARLLFGSFVTVTGNTGPAGSSALDVDANGYMRMGRVRIHIGLCWMGFCY